jgi:RNA polymerase sigma-70 factor (ECF subfamily)
VASHNPSSQSVCSIHPAVTANLELHIDALRRYSRALVGNVADADDLVQETLKRALIYAHGGKEIRNARSYLLTMLHNVRVDYAKRERWNERQPLTDHLFPVCRATQPDRIVCDEVIAAIKDLPKEQRDVLLLTGLDDLSYQDIADRLGIPIGTVMSRLSRGRKALQKALNREDAPAGALMLYRTKLRRAAERSAATYG